MVRRIIMRKHGLALALLAAIVSVVPAFAGCVDELPVLAKLEAKDVEMTMRFEGVPLGNIFQALRAAGGFKLEGASGLDAPANLYADHTPLQQLLAVLALKHGLTYEVPDEGTLVVRRARAEDLVPAPKETPRKVSL
jgi:hypothetical protein